MSSPNARRFAVSMPTTILLSLFMAAILGFFLVSMAGPGAPAVAAAVSAALLLVPYVQMLRTGEVSKWRRVFYFAVALLFAPAFIATMIEGRGTMALSAAEVFKNETPFCHIVIPMAILPYLATGNLIFPARLTQHFASVYAMLAIWIVATLAIGRGWCAWACFYGGWDDGFSRASRRARLPITDPGKRLRYLGFAVLAFVVLAALGTMSAVYCTWLCPFKAITEFGEVTNLASYIAMLIFVLLFFALAVVLPILSRRRVQCMSLCPFGAFQSIAGKASPYRIRIDREKCVDCGACIAACPTLSLDDESVKKGKALATCTLCGECMSACPKGAVDYSFAWSKGCGTKERLFARTIRRIESSAGDGKLGLPARAALAALRTIDELLSARILMITCGYVIGCVLGGSFASGTLLRLWNLLSSGSFALK